MSKKLKRYVCLVVVLVLVIAALQSVMVQAYSEEESIDISSYDNLTDSHDYTWLYEVEAFSSNYEDVVSRYGTDEELEVISAGFTMSDKVLIKGWSRLDQVNSRNVFFQVALQNESTGEVTLCKTYKQKREDLLETFGAMYTNCGFYSVIDSDSLDGGVYKVLFLYKTEGSDDYEGYFESDFEFLRYGDLTEDTTVYEVLSNDGNMVIDEIQGLVKELRANSDDSYISTDTAEYNKITISGEVDGYEAEDITVVVENQTTGARYQLQTYEALDGNGFVAYLPSNQLKNDIYKIYYITADHSEELHETSYDFYLYKT